MTLYINCCVREESRTDRLARAVLKKLGGDFTELKLYEESLKPLDRETLSRRTALIEQGDYSDKLFDCAKQWAKELYYVTTAGGPYDPTYSYGYIESLAKSFFGIPTTHLVKAEMLDIIGNDAKEILQSEIAKLLGLSRYRYY